MSSAVRLVISALFAFLFAQTSFGQAKETIQAIYTPVGVPSAVAYSPDGKNIAVGAGNGEGAVQVTALSSGAVICLPTAATNGVSVVAFSPDGSQLLVGGSYLNTSGNSVGVLEIWNPQTGRLLSVLPTGATGAVNTAAFSPDGGTVAAGGTTSTATGELEIWRAGAKLPSKLATGINLAVNSLGFSSDSTELIVGGIGSGSAGVVELWSVSSAARLGSISNYSTAGVYSVAFSPDGSVAAIGGQTANGSGVVEFRDTSSGASISVLPTYIADNVTALAFNPSGTLLATGGLSSTGGTVELWNVPSGKPYASLASAAGAAIHSICFSADGKTLLDGGEAQTASSNLYGIVERWTVATQKLISSISSDDSYGGINSIALSKDRKTAAAGGSGSLGGILEIWSPVSGKLTLLPTAASYTVNTIAYSPDGSVLADGGVSQDTTGTYGSVVELWNTSKNTLIGSLATSADLGVGSVAFSPDGKTLAVAGSGTNGGVLELWSVATGNILATLSTASVGGVFSVAFSPDGTQLAAGGWTGSSGVVEIWNVATKKLAQNIGTAAVQVTNICYSPDGKQLAVGGAGDVAGVCEIWVVSTGKLLWTLPLAGNTYGVAGLGFTASGRVLILSTGANIQGFELSGGTLMQTLNNGQLSLFVPSSGGTLTFGTAVGGLAVAENPFAGYVPLSGVIVSPKSVVGGQSSIGTVTLAGAAPSGGTSVPLSSSTSLAAVPASVEVAAGATSATFTIQTIGVDQRSVATISASGGSNLRSASIEVTPATLTTWTTSTPSVTGGTPVKLTAQLTGLAGASGVLLKLSSSDPAIAVPASLTVASGNSAANLTVATVGVSTKKTVKVTVSAGAIVRSVAVIVSPATMSAFTLSPATALGGTTVQGTVTLNGLAGPEGEVVAVQSSSSSAVPPKSVLVPSGQSVTSFDIATRPVATSKAAVITAKVGTGSKTASLTINPPSLSTEVVNPSSVTGGSTATGTVTISSPAPIGGLAIRLLSNSSVAIVPATVVVAAQGTVGTFLIHTHAVAKSTSVSIASTFNGIAKSASLTVTAASLKSLVVSPSSIKGGLSATGTVALSGAAPTGGFKVVLASNSSSAIVPATVTVPAGKTSFSFAIKTLKVTAATAVTVSGKGNGLTVSGSLTVD